LPTKKHLKKEFKTSLENKDNDISTDLIKQKNKGLSLKLNYLAMFKESITFDISKNLFNDYNSKKDLINDFMQCIEKVAVKDAVKFKHDKLTEQDILFLIHSLNYEIKEQFTKIDRKTIRTYTLEYID
jgi:hypothetical protein